MMREDAGAETGGTLGHVGVELEGVETGGEELVVAGLEEAGGIDLVLDLILLTPLSCSVSVLLVASAPPSQALLDQTLVLPPILLSKVAESW